MILIMALGRRKVGSIGRIGIPKVFGSSIVERRSLRSSSDTNPTT
jgi:hypothetical protein